MPRITLALIICVSFCGAFAFGSDTSNAGALSKAVDTLKSFVEERQISRIEVINIPWYIKTRTALDPAMLKSTYKYKLTINDAENTVKDWGFVALLNKVRQSSSTDSGDLRWGFIFDDAQGHELFTTYADGR